MFHHHRVLFPLLLLLFALTSYLAGAGRDDKAEKSAYDVLRKHGLPIGLLPKGVKGFQFDGEGRFEVNLNGPCAAKLESGLRYDRNVSGTLSYGEIAFLSGMSAQDLFLWFPVKGIRVDVPSSGIIYFDVGVVYKQFSLSLFDTPPECTPITTAVGLDIGNGAHLASLVSESKLGKLRYDLDQEDPSRAVL